MHTLVVDVPALPSQQYMDPLIAVADANGSNFTDSLPQRPIILLDGLVIINCSPKANNFTGPPFANTIGQIEIIDQTFLLGWL